MSFPLKLIFPEVEIPVVVMSLQAGLDPALQREIGAALRGLRDQEVLNVEGCVLLVEDVRRRAPARSAFATHALGLIDCPEPRACSNPQ